MRSLWHGARAAAPPAGRATPVAAGTPETVRLDFASCDIWLAVTSRIERRWRTRACAKEPWTVEWLLNDVQRGQVLYDIGANVGTFTLIAARHCGASVVAFEPGYSTFARLCENLQLNGCTQTVIPVPIPVADRNGLTTFRYRSPEPGQSRHQLRDTPWTPGASADADGHYIQPVCTMTLDSMVEVFGLTPPDHIKLDVDGAELRVLQGATAVLASPRLRTVLIEIDQELWDPVHAHLTSAGLTLRERFQRSDKPKAPTYAVFVRP
jgi:FkbM family methyltransferase